MSSHLSACLVTIAVASMAMSTTPSAFADHRPDIEGGEAEVLGVGPEARDAAIAAAIADWKREVHEETGHIPRWRYATEKRIECEIERGPKTECEVEARPNF